MVSSNQILGNFLLSILLILFKHDGTSSTKFKKVWGVQPIVNPCTPNSVNLLNLVNLACSNAQSTNTTARDACYGCFARFVTLPPDDSQLLALTLCATTYFANTIYAQCAIRLGQSSNTGTVIITTATTNPCTSPYCEFVQCLRGVNSNSLIVQCSREVLASAPINVATDAGAIALYTNMTSCILAKVRCGLYNPITGSPQQPGVLTGGTQLQQRAVPLYNTLQIARDGSLRIITIPGTIAYPAVFCSAQTSFAQSNWLTNVCP